LAALWRFHPCLAALLSGRFVHEESLPRFGKTRIPKNHRLTGLHDHQIRLVVFEDCSEVLTSGGRGEKPWVAGSGVEVAAGGVEFAEV
jgi:hypothetical protein